MQLHLTADTVNAVLLGALRENNATGIKPPTSNYVWRFENQQTKEVTTVCLPDLSPYPATYQAFNLVLTGSTALGLGDHVYRLYNASGDTVNDAVGEALITGFATVHGSAAQATAYSEGDGATVIAYE